MHPTATDAAPWILARSPDAGPLRVSAAAHRNEKLPIMITV